MKWWRGSGGGIKAITTPVVRGDLAITVTERGELESSRSVEVRCEIEGKDGAKLVSIVPEGTRVSQGQEVASFDTDALQKEIALQEVTWKQADGKARAAKAELEVQENKQKTEIAKADLAAQLADLDLEKYEKAEYVAEFNEKKGALDLAKRNLEEAESNKKFTDRLVTRGLAQMEQQRLKEMEVQEKEYLVERDKAKLLVLEYDRRRKITEFKYKAEDAKLELERVKKSTQAAVEKARSEWEAAAETAKLELKQLERLKAQLDRYVVKAPQEGIVVYYRRPWDDSTRIQNGAVVHFQQPIFTLPDLAQMKVKVKVHESVVKKVKPGQQATIQVDALPNQILHGTVKSVATLAQNEGWRSSVKEYLTEVSIDDLPEGAGLKPGMTGEVRIMIQTLQNVLMVPVQAVTESDGKHYAYVVSGGRVERREVTIGEANEQFVQVTSGLEEGEEVTLDARARAAAEARQRDGDQKNGKPADNPNRP